MDKKYQSSCHVWFLFIIFIHWFFQITILSFFFVFVFITVFQLVFYLAIFRGMSCPVFLFCFFFVSIFVQPMTEHASKTLCTLCWLHYCCLVIFTCGKPYWFLREWLVVNAATLQSVLCHVATSVMFTCQIGYPMSP